MNNPFLPALASPAPPETLTPLLARRVRSAQFHARSVAAVDAGLEKLRTVLDGHISTDMVHIQHGSVLTEAPSRDIARVDVGILPTGFKRRWQNRGAFTPDAALGISLFFTDNYTYSPQNDPIPVGRLSLNIVLRSWGRIPPDEMARIARSVDGTSVHYGALGFDMFGTSVSVVRREGDVLEVDELERLLAPLVPHVIDYFRLMRMRDLGDG